MDPGLIRATSAIDDHHYWLVARRRIVRHLVELVAPGRPAARAPLRILEVGCGRGSLLGELGSRHRVFGVEPDPFQRESARRLGLTVLDGRLPDRLPFPEDSFDMVLALDVLEHVRDDGAAVSRLASMLRPGGVLLVTVPAHPWLWSRWDAWNHHWRRYTRAALGRIMAVPGLAPPLIRNLNGFLFPAVVGIRLAKRTLGIDDGAEGHWLPPSPLNALLGALCGLERFLVRPGLLPVGVSLVAIATRRATP